ncbi:MAG: PAS domain S-box protein [Alphaproteobacteria bacterium]
MSKSADAWLRLTVDGSADAVVFADEQGTIRHVNTAFEALLGGAAQDLVGRPLHTVLRASTDQTEQAPAAPAPSTGRSEGRRRYVHDRDGGIVASETVSLAVRRPDGSIRGSLHILHDASDRIRRAEAWADLIAFVADCDLRREIDVCAWLELGCRFFGCDLAVFCASGENGDHIEAVAGSFASRITKPALLKEERWSLGEGSENAPTRHRPDGDAQDAVDVDILLSAVIRGREWSYGRLSFAQGRGSRRAASLEDRQGLQFMATWLAAFKDAQIAWRTHEEREVGPSGSEEHFRHLYEKTPAILHSIDAAGRIVIVSDAWLSMMGYRRSEVIGRLSTDFLTLESRRYAQDVVLPAYREAGRCHDIAYQFVTKSGEVRDVELSAVSQVDQHGTFIRSLAVLLDVTEQKKTERMLMRKSAALEQSNDDLRRIAQIASHDLREPLRRVIAYSDILKEDFGAELSEDALNIAGMIQSGGRRLRLMLNDLLAYVCVREEFDCTFEPVDLSAVIGHSLDDLDPEIKARNVRFEIAHLPLVWGRMRLLKLVLDHLLSNAVIHGCEREPVVEVSVDDAGDAWRFAVADQGRGIAPRHADRIFEMFRRLQHSDEIEGSGAGLAICRLIIRRCGGEIWLDHSYGKGARFLFTLPKYRLDTPKLIPMGGL